MGSQPRIAINGFGRIGRTLCRILSCDPSVRLVAVNDLMSGECMSHLLKYDSIHGRFNGALSRDGVNLTVNHQRVSLLNSSVPSELPWADLDVDYVVECTGDSNIDNLRGHLDAGAKRVIVSAPLAEADFTTVMGVNNELYDPARHYIVSNASCTTNCLTPVLKVISDKFGIRKGLVTTVHAYTNDQNLFDNQHADLRRARSAMLSMIPTTTGAALAVGTVLPELRGKLDGVSVRVPIPDVSLADITLSLNSRVSVSEVNKALKAAAGSRLSRILGYSEEPLVSVDYIGSPLSAIVDGTQTRIVGGDLLKVSAWYDNEFGYSNRLRDLIAWMYEKEEMAIYAIAARVGDSGQYLKSGLLTGPDGCAGLSEETGVPRGGRRKK